MDFEITAPKLLLKANPNRNRVLIQNLTAAADVLISKDFYNVDEFDDHALIKLIGIDKEEMLHYKGELYVLAVTATADVRVFEE